MKVFSAVGVGIGFLVSLSLFGGTGAQAAPFDGGRSAPRRNADAFARDLELYVLFGIDDLSAKGLHIPNGDIGVSDGSLKISSHGFLDAPTSQVVASTVRLPLDSQCSELFANDFLSSASGCSNPTSFAAPVVADVAAACGFPDPFPSCNTSQTLSVQSGEDCPGDSSPGNGECDLPPGIYGSVRVSSGTLVLTGGSYTFCKLRVSRDANVLYDAPVEINVTGNVDFGTNATLDPAPSSGATADDLQLFSDGDHLHFSRSSQIMGRFCAPDAQLRMTSGSSLTGTAVAKRIRTERVTVARRDTAATTTTVTTTSTTTSTLTVAVTCGKCTAPPAKLNQYCATNPDCNSPNMNDGMCNTFAVGTINVGVSASGRGVEGTFTVGAAYADQAAAAQACGEDHFNWYQIVTADNHPPKNAAGNVVVPPYVDPPPGGYSGGALQWADGRPWYWDEGAAPPGGTPGYLPGYNVTDHTNGKVLDFSDFPGGQRNTNLSFRTWLVSVQANGTFHSWHGGFSWDWSNSTGSSVAGNIQGVPLAPTAAEYTDIIGGF